MTKVVVLGSTGMLGSAIGKYFQSKENYDTILTYRNNKVAYGKNNIWFDAIDSALQKFANSDYIINCIGVIKPFIEDNKEHSIYLNSLFPYELSSFCKKENIRLIHITTDCVFSGMDGNYSESSIHDALDFYGKSKSLGEPDNCMVLRTSIIGEELHNNVSLIEWVKSMKGQKVKGFTNHYWNGMTTNQYAKVCDIVTENYMSLVSDQQVDDMFDKMFEES